MKLYRCTKSNTYCNGKIMQATEAVLYKAKDLGDNFPLKTFVNISTGAFLEDEKALRKK